MPGTSFGTHQSRLSVPSDLLHEGNDPLQVRGADGGGDGMVGGEDESTAFLEHRNLPADHLLQLLEVVPEEGVHPAVEVMAVMTPARIV